MFFKEHNEYVLPFIFQVYPFASIADAVGYNIPRILINKDYAGNIGSRPKDLVLTGDLVDTIQELSKELGWDDELQKLIGKT